MIELDYGRAEPLFSQYDLRASLDGQRERLMRAAQGTEILAGASDGDLERTADTLLQSYRVHVPVLDRDNIRTSSEVRQRDVSQDFNRAIFDRSRPFMRDFETIVFHVPFTGERDLFRMRASTFSMSPPHAELGEQELRIALMTEGEVTADEVKRALEGALGRIEEGLQWVAADVGPAFEAQLRASALQALTEKRNRQASTRNLLDDLGFTTAPPKAAAAKAREQKSARDALAPVAPASTRRPAIPEPVPERDFKYDFFISHASEDKDDVARPLYERLSEKGYRVWFDEAELRLGDSLIRKIDEGLRECRHGIVVMSPRFFEKRWTDHELSGLRTRQVDRGPGIILPVWKDIDVQWLKDNYPTLADLVAADLADGLDAVIDKIVRAYGR